MDQVMRWVPVKTQSTVQLPETNTQLDTKYNDKTEFMNPKTDPSTETSLQPKT